MTGNDILAGSEGGPQASSRLYERVARDRRSSIERAVNLDIGDFACRMLVLNAVWVPITESALVHPGRGRETASQPDGIGREELCAEAASAISERIRILGL